LHLAAESHVDRSITDPLSLWKQMLLGQWICWMPQNIWKGNYEGKRFITVQMMGLW
jgi:dTDP-glucose 4,6-dehydratase